MKSEVSVSDSASETRAENPRSQAHCTETVGISSKTLSADESVEPGTDGRTADVSAES